MDSILLNNQIQQFINANLGTNIAKLALTKNPFPQIEWAEILNQIAAKSKAKEKLPTWFNLEAIIYPDKISIEQASSEITAEYKSQFISGNSLIDLSGGFGVDDYYFSKKINKVIHCEINVELSAIVKHNAKKLGAENVECLVGDSTAVLKSLNKKFDWIYVDPSRRNEVNRKVFLLKDCLPNAFENLDLYFSYTDNIMIKTSPLLDISAGLNELKNVKSIHIIAVKNEVKELVWILEKGYSGRIMIRAADISKEVNKGFEFEFATDVAASYSLPKKYLYEPNAAVMKSGGFSEVSATFNIAKLHLHSHLYTSDQIIAFPGRIFEIREMLPYHKSAMTTLRKANITTRNFPDSVENIRKKWKIADGGDVFCFFTTDLNADKIVLICTKILSP